jgi:hypothetical protein
MKLSVGLRLSQPSCPKALLIYLCYCLAHLDPGWAVGPDIFFARYVVGGLVAHVLSGDSNGRNRRTRRVAKIHEAFVFMAGRLAMVWRVLFSIAVIWAMAVALHRLLGGAWPPLVLPVGVPAEGLGVALPLLFIINMFIGGPLAEDVGWRGYALPKLGARLGALRASLIIGVVWALWHLPFFVIPQGAAVVGGIPFGWFMLLTTAWSVLFAWVFVNTQESILLPVLYQPLSTLL